MESASSIPPSAERTALEQIERAEAAAKAALTPRVRTRALIMIDRLLRAREIEQAGRDLGKLIDAIHKEIAESGLPAPTDEEIEAEIQAVRTARKQRALEAKEASGLDLFISMAGQDRSGEHDVSADKYRHLADAYADKP